MRHQLLACAFVSMAMIGGAALAADQAGTASNTNTGGNPTAQAAAPTSPKDACNQLVAAAQKDDFSTIKNLSMSRQDWHGRNGQAPGQSANQPGQNDSRMRQGFEKMRQDHMAQLKNLTCGSEQVAGDHAFVVAKTSDQAQDQRLIPFVKEGDTWKFDPHTYMSFYRGSMSSSSGNTGTNVGNTGSSTGTSPGTSTGSTTSNPQG